MHYFQKIISNTFGESGDIEIQPLNPTPSKLPLLGISDYGNADLEEHRVPENQDLSSVVSGNPQINEGNDSKAMVTEKITHKPRKENVNIVGKDHRHDNKNPAAKASDQNIPEFSHKKETEKKLDSKTKKASKNPDFFQKTDISNKIASEESDDPDTTHKKPVEFSPTPTEDKTIITNQKKGENKHPMENLPEDSSKRPQKTETVFLDIPVENNLDPTKQTSIIKEKLTQGYTNTQQVVNKSAEITPRQIPKEMIPDKSMPRTHVTIGKINIEVVPPPPKKENKKIIEKKIIYKSSGPPAKPTFNNNTGLNVRFGLGQL